MVVLESYAFCVVYSLTASAKPKVITNVESSEDDEDEDLTEEEKGTLFVTYFC